MNPQPGFRILSRRCVRNTYRTPVSSSLLRHSTTARYVTNRPFEQKQDFEEEEDVDRIPRNPIDPITLHRLEAKRRAYYMRRTYLSAAGAVICMIIPLIIIQNMEPPGKNKDIGPPKPKSVLPQERLDASGDVVAQFEGKPVVVAPGGEKLIAQDQKSGEEVEVVPTGTSTIPHFPKTIHVPSSGPTNKENNEYTLLGLGIRTVSFLGIQVYVLGLYVQTSSLAELQSSLIKKINPTASALIPGEKEKLRQALLDPEESYKIWDEVLREKGSRLNTAVRIVPVRNTDFQHLRDGWVRGITQRVQQAAQKGDSEYADETFGAAMKDFKAMFSQKGKAPKGSVLVLLRGGDGVLGALYQEKEGAGQFTRIGEVRDERVARQVWLGYLGGKNVSSEGARKGVVDGVMALVERPVGTIETRVT